MPSSRTASRPGGLTRRALSLLVSCEHGGARVPAEYAPLFENAEAVLASHRGYDWGALELAAALSARLGAPLHASRTTRLLVDLNRSERHRALYSEYTAGLPPEAKARLLAEHYRPYRDAVEAAVAAAVAAGRCVVHVSAHSFTPVFEGRERRTDVGLLYDPARPGERALAASWRAALAGALAGFAIHRNAPYRGVADGLVTHLRRRFEADEYIGLELEINQRFVPTSSWPMLVATVADTLGGCLEGEE